MNFQRRRMAGMAHFERLTWIGLGRLRLSGGPSRDLCGFLDLGYYKPTAHFSVIFQLISTSRSPCIAFIITRYASAIATIAATTQARET